MTNKETKDVLIAENKRLHSICIYLRRRVAILEEILGIAPYEDAPEQDKQTTNREE